MQTPEADQMTVIVANSTPYVIWRVEGGLIGACRSRSQAFDIMRDLKTTFPDRDYICRDVDGDLCGDTRTMNGEQMADRLVTDRYEIEGVTYSIYTESELREANFRIVFGGVEQDLDQFTPDQLKRVSQYVEDWRTPG